MLQQQGTWSPNIWQPLNMCRNLFRKQHLAPSRRLRLSKSTLQFKLQKKLQEAQQKLPRILERVQLEQHKAQ